MHWTTQYSAHVTFVCLTQSFMHEESKLQQTTVNEEQHSESMTESKSTDLSAVFENSEILWNPTTMLDEHLLKNTTIHLWKDRPGKFGAKDVRIMNPDLSAFTTVTKVQLVEHLGDLKSLLTFIESALRLTIFENRHCFPDNSFKTMREILNFIRDCPDDERFLAIQSQTLKHHYLVDVTGTSFLLLSSDRWERRCRNELNQPLETWESLPKTAYFTANLLTASKHDQSQQFKFTADAAWILFQCPILVASNPGANRYYAANPESIQHGRYAMQLYDVRPSDKNKQCVKQLASFQAMIESFSQATSNPISRRLREFMFEHQNTFEAMQHNDSPKQSYLLLLMTLFEVCTTHLVKNTCPHVSLHIQTFSSEKCIISARMSKTENWKDWEQ